MRFFYTILIGLLLLSVGSYSQTVTELIMPQYLHGYNWGASGTPTRVPFVYRLKIEGLLPNTTYRYMSRFISDASNATAPGEGNFILINPSSGEFKRITSPTVATTGNCGLLITDAAGAYTGWFANEAGTGTMFTPGTELMIRVSLNDGTTTGSSANQIKHRLDTDLRIKVINFGSTTADGTALRSTPAAGTSAKNFVMLYDNIAGSGQPVSATVIESDGVLPTLPNGTSAGVAPFYVSDVDGIDKAWGTIIPNNLTGGIQKIVQYNFAGGEVANRVSSNGFWPTTGGTTVSTKSASGGVSNVIVLDGSVVTLAPGAPIKLNQQITFNDLPPATYGDADFVAAATASSGFTVTYASSNTSVATIVNGDMIHIVGAGTADITATQTGDDNYGAATPVTKQLIVNKANLTITADDRFWVQGTPMPTLTLTFSGFKNGDDETDLLPQPQVATTATSSSATGPYPITVVGSGSPNYNITHQPGTLTIVPGTQSQTITFTTLANKMYGDADFNPGATSNSGLTVTYTSSNPAVATIINNTIIHVVSPGTTMITAKQGGDVTYDPAPDVDQPLVVRKAPLQIIADNKTRLVGQPNPTLTIVYSGFVRNENSKHLITQPAISTTADKSSLAGNYVIKVENATSDNYDITHVNGILTVLSLPAQQIRFDNLPVKKYGNGNFNLAAKASSGLAVSYTSSNPAVAAIVGDTAIRITGAGTADITASQAGNAFYGPANPVIRTLTVQKAVLNIRADNKSKNEGDANPPLTVTYTGFVNNEDAGALTTMPEVTTTASAISVAGAYSLVPQGAASNNYLIQYQPGTLTILPSQGEGQENIVAYSPAPGQLQVNVYAGKDVKTAIQLFDLSGARLVNTTVSLKKGFNTYRLSIGNLAPGIYNMRVAGNDVMLKTKVVIR